MRKEGLEGARRRSHVHTPSIAIKAQRQGMPKFGDAPSAGSAKLSKKLWLGAASVLFFALSALAVYVGPGRAPTVVPVLADLKSFKTPAGLELGLARILGKQRPLKVYMYELPDWLDEGVRLKPYQAEWLTISQEYNGDVWVRDFIANASFRTFDPEEATLFYMPFFPTRFLHHTLVETGSWTESVKASNEHLKWGVHWVAHHWPYWDRNNGRDHFTTLTGDHGRCLHMGELDRADFGDMFVLQHLGDLTMHNRDGAVRDSVSDATADSAQPWPCYDKGADILLPAYLPVEELPIVSPFASPRGLGVTYRFDPVTNTGGHPYHHVKIRQEVVDNFFARPLRGADWRVNGLHGTIHDFANSTFCITPPGVVAHTSRYWRSIALGCIPVSFYRAYDLPFQDQLSYPTFSVNVQPDDVNRTHTELSVLIDNEPVLRKMQTALLDAQRALNWDEPEGIPRLLTKELAARSKALQQ